MSFWKKKVRTAVYMMRNLLTDSFKQEVFFHKGEATSCFFVRNESVFLLLVLEYITIKLELLDFFDDYLLQYCFCLGNITGEES